MYVEEQVRDKGFDIGGSREKAGRFFSLGRVQNNKQVRTGVLIAKTKCIEYVFELRGQTGFEVPPPPLSIGLTPHCAHHITIT